MLLLPARPLDGPIVQDSEPEAWHWDGSYWFDRARGAGGVHVANFRIGGQPADFAPYAPPEFKPYRAGRGWRREVDGEVEADLSARSVDSRAERGFVYYHPDQGRQGDAQADHPGSHARTLRRTAIWRLGPAHQRAAQTDRWDLAGGGELRIGWRGTPSTVASRPC